MINVDVKCRRGRRKMAQRIQDPARLRLLQQFRRDLTQPWDQVDNGSLALSIGLTLLVLIVAKTFLG